VTAVFLVALVLAGVYNGLVRIREVPVLVPREKGDVEKRKIGPDDRYGSIRAQGSC
jgi:hypothetical protein